MEIDTIGLPLRLPMAMVLVMLAASEPAHAAAQREVADVSAADLGLLLTGRYENSAQVAHGKAMGEKPPPQHVTITIEPTQQADWELWRVHMDVDPAVAQSAGSDTSLDAIWAMNISRVPNDNSIQLIPFTLKPSVNDATVKAPAFDAAQWLSLEACALHADFGGSRITAQAAADEMCVAETMGLGGKRAFLPSWISREGDRLRVQLIYFGKPWRVDARRVSTPKG
ncbi:MAG: hypothetical protein WA803_05740 [Steroidobacteraceae bacterium]